MAKITPAATLSYPHLDKPQKSNNGGNAKYSASLVFAPGTDLTDLRKAAIEAAVEKFGTAVKLPGGKTMPVAEALEKGVLRNPFRTDAEAKGYPAGSVFLNVRTEQKPGLVLAHADPATGKAQVCAADQVRDAFYPGAIVRASIVAFGYDRDGNRGVSFALNNMQKLGEGERIDGRVAAESEFDAAMSEAPADLAGLV